MGTVCVTVWIAKIKFSQNVDVDPLRRPIRITWKGSLFGNFLHSQKNDFTIIKKQDLIRMSVAKPRKSYSQKLIRFKIFPLKEMYMKMECI